jgi:hypothetical protein
VTTSATTPAPPTVAQAAAELGRLRHPPRFADLSHRSIWVRVALHFAGILLLFLGILGFFLPILQGFLFTFLGLLVLAAANGWVRRRLDRWLDGHPRMDRLYWKTVVFARRRFGPPRGARRRAAEREQAAHRERQAARGSPA